MRDADIRECLKKDLSEKHSSEPGTIIIDELAVCDGDARADVAVVNGLLTCYEIKSSVDSLARIHNQAAVYSRVFDCVSVVTADRHLYGLFKTVPEWWGLIVARESNGEIKLETHREGEQSPCQCVKSVASMLWKDELLAVLEEHGIDKGVRTKSRPQMRDRLCESLPASDVVAIVRQRLKLRSNWRVDGIRM